MTYLADSITFRSSVPLSNNRVNADIDKIVVNLTQVGERALRGMFHAMKNEGEIIAHFAKQFAPVDEGNLEDAIRVEEIGGGRNALGQFERWSIRVSVDENHPAAHYNKDGSVTAGTSMKIVGDYLWIMHECLLPFGSGFGDLHLGPKSQDKDAGRGVVGGKFMERALNMRLPMITQLVANAARSALI